MKILFLDIECCAEAKGFPDPTNKGDQVIQIANYVSVTGEKEPLVKTIFNLNSCSPVVGAQVLCFDDEAKLIEAWAEFIQIVCLFLNILTTFKIFNKSFYF